MKNIRVAKLLTLGCFLVGATLSANAVYVIWEEGDIQFVLKSDPTASYPPFYINGIRADDPSTPELDSFSHISIFRRNDSNFFSQIAVYIASGVSYFRTNLEGTIGSHYQFMPLISRLEGTIRQSGATQPERVDIWTENTENGMIDIELMNEFRDMDTDELLGTCTSFISFMNAARLGEDGKLYTDFTQRVNFTAAKDNLQITPMLQGLSAMFVQEGVNSLDALKWDDPEGFVHYLDVEEDDWCILNQWTERYYSIGSWYEFRSTKNSWFNSEGTQWRIEVLETSRPDLGLSLRVVNNGDLFHGAENLWTELNFENHEGIMNQGESYGASLMITTEMSENPWQTVFTNGFEALDGWLLSGGASIDPTGAVVIVERHKVPGGEGALRLEVTDTNIWSAAELTNSFDCAGASQVQVSFWYETVNLETNDLLAVELYDGTTWSRLQEMHAFLPATKDEYNDNGWPRFQRVTLAAGNQAFSSQMNVRFMLNAAQTGAVVYVDDLKVLRQEQSPPITNPDYASTGMDPEAPLSIMPLENDYDLDADPLTLVAVGSPQISGSQVEWTGGNTFTYVPPNTGFIGSDRVKYWMSDGTATNAANVILHVGAYNNGSNVYDASAVDALVGGALVSGVIKNANDSGDYFEWNFWIPFAGTYTLDFYAKSLVAYPLEVSIDGIVMDPALSFGGDGWGTYTVSPLPVFLEGGFHTVRISTNGSSGSRVPQHQQMIINAPINTFNDWSDLTYDPQELIPAPFYANLTNSSSRLRLDISFDMVQTSTYRFSTKESLTQPNWIDLTNVVPVLGETIQLTFPVTNSTGFYRLRETPFHW